MSNNDEGHEEESIEEAAFREVQEETGLDGFEIVKKLGVVTRGAVEIDGTRVRKDIHLFLMRGDSLVKAQEPEEDWDWYDTMKALEIISFKEEVTFFKSILKDLQID